MEEDLPMSDTVHYSSIPAGKTGSHAIPPDPYCPLRAENYFIEDLEIDNLHKFTGQCTVSVSNGDKFTGFFEDGFRQGHGVLTFDLINRRKLGITKLEGISCHHLRVERQLAFETTQFRGNSLSRELAFEGTSISRQLANLIIFLCYQVITTRMSCKDLE
jgi:hypothetical protein